MTVNVQILDSSTNNVIQAFSASIYNNGQLVGNGGSTSNGILSLNINASVDESETFYNFIIPGYDSVSIDGADLIVQSVGGGSVQLVADRNTSFGSSVNSGGGKPSSQNPTVSNNSSGNGSSSIIPVAAVTLGALMLLNNKKKSVGKIETKDVIPYLLIGGGLLAFGALQSIFQKLGIFTSPEAANIQKQVTDPYSFWKPEYYKQFTSFPNGQLSQDLGTQMISAIQDGFGFLSVDFPAIEGVFSQLTSKAEVSQLADYWQQGGDGDMLTYMNGFSWTETRLSDSQLNTINSLLENLPNN